MSKPVQPVCTNCGISEEELEDTPAYDGDFLCVECQLEEEHDTFDEDCKCQGIKRYKRQLQSRQNTIRKG